MGFGALQFRFRGLGFGAVSSLRKSHAKCFQRSDANTEVR